jgi:selenocysteine-specific elongation factor
VHSADVRVIATAGHVDHGKSSLVLALTGTDPDRFAEEKRRGLTIDLGFAWCTLPSGAEVSFVDVPGHVRFIKNMLAGVGAVDACLFVVAATEGWKPQSEEHLRILELLGVRHGVVALTKAALVDADLLEVVIDDVAGHIEGTFLASAVLVPVDSVAGTGLDALRAALEALVTAAPAALDTSRPRLWVDRSFAARGSGTVVTGTLTGGTLHVDDEVLIAPRGKRARVRALQALHQPRAEVGPGSRTAVNLAGVAHDEVARGDALVLPGQWHETATFDATLHVLDAIGHTVGRRGAYAAYIGSGEHPVQVRVLGGSSLRPGDDGHVRLRLASPLPLVPGDRFVLREHGRSETVGGGEVLDVDPQLPAARATPTRDVDRVVAERGWVEPETLERLTGERRPPTLGRWIVDPQAQAAAVLRLKEAMGTAGPLGLDVAGLDERERAVLSTLEGVTVRAGRAGIGPGDSLERHPVLAALEASRFDPPDAANLDRAVLRELARRGQAIERDGVWFAASAIDAAAREIADLLAARPEGVTVAQVRDALGSTRRIVLPLLAHLDATGVTRRRGDVRVAGPRLPAV